LIGYKVSNGAGMGDFSTDEIIKTDGGQNCPAARRTKGQTKDCAI